MFKPERMSLIQIVALDDDVIPVCGYLVEKKIVHLADRAIVAPALREGTPAYFSTIQTDLELLQGSLQTLSVWLGEARQTGRIKDRNKPLRIDPQPIAQEIKPRVAEAIEQFEAIKKESDKAAEEIRRLTRISDALQSFETAGVSCSELMQFNYFAYLGGTMPQRYIPALRRSLHQVTYHLEIRRLGEDEVSLIVLCPRDVLSSVQATLKSVYFSEVPIPAEYRENPKDALDMIEIQLWQQREELAQITRRMNGLKAILAPQTGYWQRLVRANLRVLNAMQLFGKTAKTTCINGWVPRKHVSAIMRELNALLEGRVIMEVSAPDDSAGLAHELMQLGKLRVPTKFAHPSFLKPFEGLVTT